MMQVVASLCCCQYFALSMSVTYISSSIASLSTSALLLTYVLQLIIFTVIMKVGLCFCERHGTSLQLQIALITLRFFDVFSHVYVFDNASPYIYNENARVICKFDVFSALELVHVTIFTCHVSVRYRFDD